MVTFEGLRRTPDGRALYAFLVLSVLLARWLRTGVVGGKWFAVGYLAIMGLLLFGSGAYA